MHALNMSTHSTYLECTGKIPLEAAEVLAEGVMHHLSINSLFLSIS